jgi:hypothetical protein
MDYKLLSRHVRQPEVLRHLLGAYQGPYSIGVGHDPAGTGGPAVIVEVVDDKLLPEPHPVQFDGEAVPVIVRGGYAQAHLLKH